MPISENMVQEIVPVSYTHLDVYKRQGLFCLGDNICYLSEKIQKIILWFGEKP